MKKSFGAATPFGGVAVLFDGICDALFYAGIFCKSSIEVEKSSIDLEKSSIEREKSPIDLKKSPIENICHMNYSNSYEKAHESAGVSAYIPNSYSVQKKE
ncbi:hypothetical protein ACFVAD_17595 [Sutcliffiella sp. NPDC057660]|uniref:hypothetical protein n=1 Tax=Sutcliffiella sp. NPDC057660 TaxID=3346199 RepID=UPI0036A4D4C3